MNQYQSQLRALYSDQLRSVRSDYLIAHSHNSAVIRRDTSIFERYSQFIPQSGRILDWGCNHAPTACLVKILRGKAVELYGCDVGGEEFRVFHEFANLDFRRLNHSYLLPYEDGFFDAVIGTAVLEHVPNDSESLKELHRILKPDGVFIVTTLPNRYSYTEYLNRRLGRLSHARLYTKSQVEQMFLHHGFRPIASGYHQVLPSLCSVGSIFDSPIANRIADAVASRNTTLERLWPVRCVASNLFIVGRKVSSV